MSICFAGLDWASRTHAACVIDERGRIIAVNNAWQEFAAANGARSARAGDGAD